MSKAVPAASERRRDATRSLSRRIVAAAALAVIDDDGVDAMTMRGVAARLGVKAQSLYVHVQSRADLLEAVVASVSDEIDTSPALHEPDAAEAWPAAFTAVANRVRGAAHRHPQAFRLMASPAIPARPSSWYPPFRADPWTLALLDCLTAAGLTEEAASGVFRAFREYLVGFLLLETDDLIRRDPPLGDRDADFNSGLVALIEQLSTR